MLDARPYFSIFLNWSGNEVILIINNLQAFTLFIPNSHKVPSIVQFRIFFILLASLVPKPNFLCTHTLRLLQNVIWTHSMGKLVPNYKLCRHVVAPIRLLR